MSDKAVELVTRIRPVKQEEVEMVQKLAQEDSHSVFLPTQLVERKNQVLGGLTLGIPSCFVWLDTKRSGPRDAQAVMNFYENQLACMGHPFVIVPCTPKSPFRPLLEPLGYLNLGNYDILLRKL